MLFFPFLNPPLDWVQLEITTSCNAACLYCPRTNYRTSWIDRHFSLQAFISLLPSLRSLTRHVHLQGWGEPLLHPDFFEMVRLAKKEGFWVSTTSNGSVMDRERVELLLDSGMDLVALSLAGSREETHDRIRKGTTFSQVLTALNTLQKLKKDKRCHRPQVHVAFMALRSNWAELWELPSLLAGLDIAQVVISTLDFIPRRHLQQEAIRPTSAQEEKELKAVLEEVSLQGKKEGMKISYTLPTASPRGRTCAENPLKALCLAADGLVTPCVYTNLPIEGETYFAGLEERVYLRKGLGNVMHQSLLEVWRGQATRLFQKSFQKRKPDPFCRWCPKLR